MSYWIQRIKRKKVFEHELVRTTPFDNDEVVTVGKGNSDVDAAISLDIEAQAMRAAAQLNYTRAREEEAAADVTDDYEPEVIIPATERN